jgi:hypothetical protein
MPTDRRKQQVAVDDILDSVLKPGDVRLVSRNLLLKLLVLRPELLVLRYGLVELGLGGAGGQQERRHKSGQQGAAF